MDSRLQIENLLTIFVLLLLAVGCFVVLRPFLVPLLWAIILTISTWTAFDWVKQRLGGRAALASTVMTTGLTLFLLVPLIVVGFALADNATTLSRGVRAVLDMGPPDPPEWIGSIPFIGDFIVEEWTEIAGDAEALYDIVRPHIGTVTNWLIASGGKLGQGFVDMAISITATFFFYLYGMVALEQLNRATERLGGKRAIALVKVAGDTMRGVVHGIIGTAIGQAICAGAGFYIASVPGALLLGFLTFFLAIIPFGAPLVWIPAAIWLVTEGQTGWAVFLALWGLLVVGSVDNFIKPILISRSGTMPLLLVFLGIIGGALAFGFLGIFLGPILLAVGYTLVKEWITATRVAPEAAD